VLEHEDRGAVAERDRGWQPSRRAVVRGAAWATPAVVIAAAAPSVAASVTVALRVTGSGCKLPGNSNDLVKGYVFGIEIVNSGAVAADVTLTQITIDGTSLDASGILLVDAATGATVGAGFQVAAGSVRDLALFTRNYTRSQAGTLQLTYTFDPVGPSPAVPHQQITATVTGSTWNGGCRPFAGYAYGLPQA
jgi:hypothetical protein